VADRDRPAAASTSTLAVSARPVIRRRCNRAALPRLHVLTDTRFGRDPLAVVRAALSAGARAIQVRDKGATDRGLLDLTRRVVELAEPSAAYVLVDDRVDIAMAAEACGAHLGSDDLPLAVARVLGGARFLLGGTARDAASAVAAEADDADYVGVGPAFSTTTKSGLPDAIGVPGVQSVARATALPVIAIGGITPVRVPALLAAGAHGIAVVTAISQAADPAAAAAAFLRALPAPT